MDITGFKVNFLGDSITEGMGVLDKKKARYDRRLLRMCNLSEVNNYGISGTRLAHQMSASKNPRQDLCFCGRAYNMDKSADMVIVYGGVNDYIHGDAPFGEIGDKTNATFCGAVYFLMDYLKKTYAGRPVVFLTPARCIFGDADYRYPSTHPAKREDARALVEYVRIIVETAKQFDIPALNLYENLGIDPVDEESRNKYTADGLHFNDCGHEVLAECIKNFIDAL